jgi:signal transduction histidine kinase
MEVPMDTAAKILIVDDDPGIHEVLETFITSKWEAGAKPFVFHAENGQVALDVLGLNPEMDVIVLDLNMPVMDGYSFLEHVGADLRFQNIPVCVLTGNTDDAVRALNLGARDYIAKTGDYAEIRLRIMNLIEIKHRAESGERSKIGFLSTVSHELLTPMNGVIGAMQLLQTTELTDEQSEYIEMLEESTNSMMAMVNNCLNFLQSDDPLHHLPVIPFNLRATVQETLDSLVTEAQRHCVTLPPVEVSPGVPDNLVGLPDRLQLIFYHLFINAIRFSPAGKVVARIEDGPREGASVQLRCSVTDTGIGISLAKQSDIFEPFIQVDTSSTRKIGGLGIGLSIASRLVQMMGGAIMVESTPGGGSTFSFAVNCAVDPCR